MISALPDALSYLVMNEKYMFKPSGKIYRIFGKTTGPVSEGHELEPQDCMADCGCFV